MVEESRLRRQFRQAVVSGGSVLREAAGGLREGLQLLQAPAGSRDGLSPLELELEEARRHGRWLSDDERAAIAADREAALRQRELERDQRRSLLLVLVVAILLPPLWPLALGLIAYLLFPRTTRRLTLAALAFAGIGVVLLIAALIAVLVVLL